MSSLARTLIAATVSALAATLAVAGPLASSAHAAPAAPVSAAAEDPILPGSAVGVSPGYTILWESEADQARDLDAIAATGADWVRIDFFWPSLQPSETFWNWSYWDRLINMANERGLKVVGLPTYTPQWTRPAGTTSTTPPSDLNLWATFMEAIVARYAPMGVHTWEIWNEPNIGNWSNPNFVDYTNLLKASYTAVKSVDPTATVIVGGLSPAADLPGMINPVTFVTGMYAAGAKGYFDAMAVHPYSFPWHPTDPTTASWNTFLRVPLIHDVMVANGDGAKKIWLTEFGAPTGTTQSWAVSEAEQGEFVTEGFNTISTWSYAGPVFWYSHRDRGTNPDDREDHFGLLHIDFTPKASYAVFDAAVGDANPPEPMPVVPADYVSAAAPVIRLYEAYFRRVPDYPGLMWWIGQLDNGSTLSSVSAFFAISPEFQATYGPLDNSAFIDLVYQNVLGRLPDANGRAYWLGRLATGSITRPNLMIGFSESAEYISDETSEVDVITAYAWATAAMPSASSFALWVGRLDAGTPVSDLLLELL